MTRVIPVDQGAGIDNYKVGFKDFLLILLALVAMAAVVQGLEIEQGMDLPRLMWIAVGGYAAYSFSPRWFRLPLILAVNVVALLILFDPVSAAATLVLGVLLVIVATLPILVRYRLLLLLLIAVYLALGRAEIIGDYLLYQVSGVLGGLFMFRTILYLYEMQYEKESVSFWKRLNYFFLLPNLVFQLFPVVDYKTFIRSHHAKPAAETGRKALYFIGTGIVHLLLYRAIYHYMVPLEEEIDGPLKLLQFMVFSYAMIVRLSGIFHLCAGVICLFGFDLPRTFDRYFLAENFGDLWQRVNGYWRSFMMKIAYFPVYFRLRNLGKKGVFLTVMITFLVNFVFHTYQWFWVKGTVQVTETDVLFWGGLGLLLAINSIMPSRKRPAPGASASYSHRAAMVRTLKILGVFLTMSALWSLWTSGSLKDWLYLFIQAGWPDMRECVMLFSLLVLVLAVGQAMQYWLSQRVPMSSSESRHLMYSPVSIVAVSGLILLVSSKPASDYMQSRDIAVLDKMTTESLSRRDLREVSKGYYDQLVVPNSITSRVWEAFSRSDPQARKERREREKVRMSGLSVEEYRKLRRETVRADDWRSMKKENLVVDTGTSLGMRLKPNLDYISKGVRTTTNEWGLKDRAYTLEKPPSTYRMALLGGSPELGSGVSVDQTIDNVVEDKLTSSNVWGPYERTEVFNFSMGKYTVFQHSATLEKLVSPFDVDAALLFLHDVDEVGRLTGTVARFMIQGRTDEYPYLADLRSNLEITGSTDYRDAVRKLMPFSVDMFQWNLQKIIDICAQNDIKLIVVYVDVLLKEPDAARRTRAIAFEHLRAAGVPVIDLHNIYEGEDLSSLLIAPWDSHPNASGHAMIADAVYREMLKNKHWFFSAQ